MTTHTTASPGSPRVSRPLVLIPLILLSGLGVLSAYARFIGHAEWEIAVTRAIQELPLFGARELSITLSTVGTGAPWAGVIALLALTLWLAAGFRIVLLFGVVSALQEVGALMKLLIERARPTPALVEVWHTPPSYSFPSGHTLGATLVGGYLLIALEHCPLPVRVRRGLQALCLAWIGLMGLSRVELGAHWPTDVIGAYMLGALLLLPFALHLRRTDPTTPRALPVDQTAGQ